MDIWEILGIDKTDDRRLIKKAYAALLKKHKPDEDPEGYMVLREAYESALSQNQEVPAQAVESDLDRFKNYSLEVFPHVGRLVGVLFSKFRSEGEGAAIAWLNTELSNNDVLLSLEGRYVFEGEVLVALAGMDKVPERFASDLWGVFGLGDFDDTFYRDYRYEAAYFSLLPVIIDKKAKPEFYEFLGSRKDHAFLFVKRVLMGEFDLISMIRLVRHKYYLEAAEHIFSWLEKNTWIQQTQLLPDSSINWWYGVYKKSGR